MIIDKLQLYKALTRKIEEITLFIIILKVKKLNNIIKIMMSEETNARLSKLFLTVLESERSIEINRQLLAENPKFETFSVFKRIDRENKNCINETNLSLYLKHSQIIGSNFEIKQMISFYDSDLDGNLSFFE